MTITDQDARALAYLARRIRADANLSRWDEPGILAALAGSQTWSLAVAAERVIRHAADPTAETPGAIRRPFLPDAPAGTAPRPPRRDEACPVCNRYRDQCDDPEHRPQPAAPDPATHIARIRASLRGTSQ